MQRRISGTNIVTFLAIATALTIAGAACGGSSAKSAAASTTATQDGGGRGQRGGGRFGGTPNPAIQTSIAQGTPFPFANRTPPAGILTSIAEGTPQAFGNRTRGPEVQTAIAQGTPASAFRGGGPGAGGAGAVAAAATVLNIDAQQLRTELQAQGASLESVAAAHGIDRATFRQQLIDAVRARLAQSVSAGTITQAMADQNTSDFESNIDSVLDRVGGGGILDAGPAGQP